MYEWIASLVQVGGLLYFMALFGIVLVYALWPRNKERFDRAAHIPLEED